MMHIVKRITALCLSLLVLMMTSAYAEVPFLVHSLGWNWASTTVEVLLKADVDTHMPFDDDRLAMLTPITDMISLRLVAGQDEGKVTLSIEEDEVLAMQYRGNDVQLSSIPDTTYQAQGDPLSVLLGTDVSVESGYEVLGLAEEGESLLTDGQALLELLPSALEKYGKRSANTTNISGYGKAAYRYDYTVNANQAEDAKKALLDICPEGWLHEILAGLSFSGKQTLRTYYTAEDVLLRAEYNGTCGMGDDLRTVKLVYKLRHDDEMDKDYIELTSPAKKGKDKNNLTFERTVETNKKGQRVIAGNYTYSVVKDGIASSWKGEFGLNNAFTNEADVISGTVTLQTKLNGAEKYDVRTITPQLTISGTADAPAVSGTVSVVEEYANKVTEQALISIELKQAEPLEWADTFFTVDLSLLSEEELTSLQQEIASSIATAIVRPLILKLGESADWFFRDLPADAVQAIIDAAGAAE